MHIKVACKTCNELFWKPKRFYKRSKNHFCSRKCCNAAKQNRVIVICTFCSSEVTKTRSRLRNSRSGFFFCDRVCKEKAQSLVGDCKAIQPNHYGTGNGKYSYRERAIKNFGNVCELCKWDGPIEVHHIDGNRANNKLQNLCVLCPNCHSLTKTNTYKVNEKISEKIERKIRLLRKQ